MNAYREASTVWQARMVAVGLALLAALAGALLFNAKPGQADNIKRCVGSITVGQSPATTTVLVCALVNDPSVDPGASFTYNQSTGNGTFSSNNTDGMAGTTWGVNNTLTAGSASLGVQGSGTGADGNLTLTINGESHQVSTMGHWAMCLTTAATCIEH